MLRLMVQVKTVLWGFIGIGGGDKTQAQKSNPLILIAIAFALVLIFVGTLAWIARLAV